MAVLADHPGPEACGVGYVERSPQRPGLHVGESGGAMDLGCLLGAAEATEGACVVRAVAADGRCGGGAREREPRVVVDRRPQCADDPSAGSRSRAAARAASRPGRWRSSAPGGSRPRRTGCRRTGARGRSRPRSASRGRPSGASRSACVPARGARRWCRCRRPPLRPHRRTPVSAARCRSRRRAPSRRGRRRRRSPGHPTAPCLDGTGYRAQGPPPVAVPRAGRCGFPRGRHPQQTTVEDRYPVLSTSNLYRRRGLHEALGRAP